MLSDEEMLSVLGRNPTGEKRVELSKAGIWLHVSEGSFEITLTQADALFSTMFGRAPVKQH